MSEHKFLQHLKKDHEEQKKLGKQLSEAKTTKEKEKLRKEFHDSLEPHIIGEEASLFKRLKNADDSKAKDAALEGLEEHHVAKWVLKELMELDLDSEGFKAKAKVLDELNRHHIEEEEGKVFDQLKKICDEKELDKLFEQYEEAEEKAKS